MTDWTDLAEQGHLIQPDVIERHAYVTGWWWGFASGLICGCGSTALLALLLWTVARALECAQC